MWQDIPEGKSQSYILGYRFDKILRTQEDLDAFKAQYPNYRIGGSSPALGMMVYKDLSGPDGTARRHYYHARQGYPVRQALPRGFGALTWAANGKGFRLI
ncbi:MAG: hypothetical protein AB2L24_03230 [Mangrovibacterium sp.]